MSSSKKVEEKEPGTDPKNLYSTYLGLCKYIGIEPYDKLRDSLCQDGENNSNYGKQILIVGDAEAKDKGQITFGPGSCRALATAILGKATSVILATKLTKAKQVSMSVIYTALQDLRIWRCPIKDGGAVAIAELLRLGGADLKISYLELLDTNIGYDGSMALGHSLSRGMNKSLVTLNLDFNPEIGYKGIAALCQGLRTNSTLKKLSLRHCSIVGKEGAHPLGEMLSFPKLSLRILDISGNSLGCSGLITLCDLGLKYNSSLEAFNISDNNIRPMIMLPSTNIIEEAQQCNDTNEVTLEAALKKFSQVLLVHKTLANIDFRYNSIGEELGNVILMPILLQIKEAGIKKICFRNEFTSLIDNTSSGKKKRGGKKKK